MIPPIETVGGIFVLQQEKEKLSSRHDIKVETIFL